MGVEEGEVGVADVGFEGFGLISNLFKQFYHFPIHLSQHIQPTQSILTSIRNPTELRQHKPITPIQLLSLFLRQQLLLILILHKLH